MHENPKVARCGRTLSTATLPILLAISGCAVSNGVAEDPGESSHVSDREAEAMAFNEYFGDLGVCLEDLGWQVDVDFDNRSLTAEGVSGPDGEDVYSDDVAACSQQLGQPPQFQPFSEEEAIKFYSLNLDTRDCLIENGIDAGQPPSEQTYVEGLMAQFRIDGAAIPWSPYEDVPGELLLDMLELCPEPSMADLY